MKVNATIKPNAFRQDQDVRLAGGAGAKAAIQSPEALLRRATLACLLWENNAYIDGVSVAEQVASLIPQVAPEIVYQLAIECRKEQKLRHIPLFIAVHMCKHEGHKQFVKDLLPQIITRADMLTDFVAIYAKENGGKVKPIASSAAKGLALAFHNFKEYHFAKYDRENEIKIRDVMFLVRPTPLEGQEELYKNIANRTLAVPDTWEVELSKSKDKKASWTRLILEEKLGGLATLRNLRNMRDASVDKNYIDQAIANVNKSMLLPSNFIMAARNAPEFSRQIEEVMLSSYDKLNKLPGRTLFIVDTSGSMGSMTSAGSTLSRLDQATAMAMLAANQCEQFELVLTADRHIHIKYPSKGFDLIKQIESKRSETGFGGIFTTRCLEWCKTNIPGGFDRVIVFSDSQDCDAKSVVPKPHGKFNYIVDVSSHTRGINYIGVWTAEVTSNSDSFLSFIAASEGLSNSFELDQ